MKKKKPIAKKKAAKKKTAKTAAPRKKAAAKKVAAKKMTKAQRHVQALQYLVDVEENETRLMVASSMGLIDE